MQAQALLCVARGLRHEKTSMFQGVWLFSLTEWQRAAGGRHEDGETSTTSGQARCFVSMRLKEAVDAMQQALEIAREHGSERRFLM